MQISITPPPLTTELHTGYGLLQGTLLPDLTHQWGNRAVIVADETVAHLYAAQLSQHCEAELIVLPETKAGIKSRETKQWLENALFARKCGRDTALIAMGGGAVTDLVGFVAATYLRGIPLIFIPTTLLGMVDAAIGGKTGIDIAQGKNLLGSYYPAKAIVSDLSTLASLPESEWQNGVAEILKAALIGDAKLWPLCDQRWRERIDLIVPRAIQLKIDTIEQDPFENGLRRILNFGHTVAHALERCSHYQISHGEAVAIGLMAESYLSWKAGLLSVDVLAEILSKLRNAGFALQLPKSYTKTQFLEAMSYDKKNLKGQVRVTLLEKIGRAAPCNGAYCCSIDDSHLQDMIDWMEKSVKN